MEKWLHSLRYAPGTRTKIRNIMSALFNHAMRYEWMYRNPITKVRASAKRLRETDILTPAEFSSLLPKLGLRERAMVMVAGSTGLRRSELVALTWSDINLQLMQINVRRSCIRNRFGDTKTEASRRPVPLHPTVAQTLYEWRADTRLCVRVRPVERQEAAYAGHGVEEVHSARARTGRHHGQGDRMA